MRYSRLVYFSLTLVILVGLALGTGLPARGATPILQFSGPGSAVCGATSISLSYSEVRDYPSDGTISVVDTGRVDSTVVDGPNTFAPPGAPNNVGTFGPFNPTFTFFDVGTTSFTYTRVWELYQGAVLMSRSTLTIGCSWNGSEFINSALFVTNEDLAPVTETPVPSDTPMPTNTPDPSITPSATLISGNATVDLPFSGPGLPGPGARNLVLFNEDTAVLSAPDGVFTGRIMRACQTAFVLTTSEDAVWGQLFVMGGWVPMENTRDVPEDYGQPGSPIAPDCVGK